MILYICPNGHWLLSFGILEALGSLHTPTESYVCMCDTCSVPMRRVEPQERVWVQPGIVEAISAEEIAEGTVHP